MGSRFDRTDISPLISEMIPDLLSFPFLFSAIVCLGEWVLDLLIPRANGV